MRNKAQRQSEVAPPVQQQIVTPPVFRSNDTPVIHLQLLPFTTTPNAVQQQSRDQTVSSTAGSTVDTGAANQQLPQGETPVLSPAAPVQQVLGHQQLPREPSVEPSNQKTS
jgi:hypothetical protein